MPSEPRAVHTIPRRDPWTRVLCLAAALTAVAILLNLLEPPLQGTASVSARACGFAVEFAGHVRCEGSVEPTLEDFCGPDRPISVELLRSGDAIEHALCAAVTPRRGSPGWQRMAPDRLAILGAPVNVNEASAAELASLPGIGPVLAARVIEGRPYSKIEDLQRVKGIGRKRLARLRERALVRWSGD